MRSASRSHRMCSNCTVRRRSCTTPTPTTRSANGSCGRRRPARCRRSSGDGPPGGQGDEMRTAAPAGADLVRSSSEGPDRHRWCLAGRAPRRRSVARRGLHGSADHHRRREPRAVRPPAAVQAGAQGWVPADHTSCRGCGRSTRTGGSAWRPLGWTGQPASAAGQRRPSAVRPPADRDRRPGPAMVQPERSRAGRRVHAADVR